MQENKGPLNQHKSQVKYTYNGSSVVTDLHKNQNIFWPRDSTHIAPATSHTCKVRIPLDYPLVDSRIPPCICRISCRRRFSYRCIFRPPDRWLHLFWIRTRRCSDSRPDRNRRLDRWQGHAGNARGPEKGRPGVLGGIGVLDRGVGWDMLVAGFSRR